MGTGKMLLLWVVLPAAVLGAILIISALSSSDVRQFCEGLERGMSRGHVIDSARGNGLDTYDGSTISIEGSLSSLDPMRDTDMGSSLCFVKYDEEGRVSGVRFSGMN